MTGHLEPERVAAVVAYLAHRDCAVSVESYYAGGGQVLRIVLAASPGYFAPELSPEDVVEHWDEVNDISDTYHSGRDVVFFTGTDDLKHRKIVGGSRQSRLVFHARHNKAGTVSYYIRLPRTGALSARWLLLESLTDKPIRVQPAVVAVHGVAIMISFAPVRSARSSSPAFTVAGEPTT